MTIEESRKKYYASVKDHGFFSSTAQDAFLVWMELSNTIRAELSPEERRIIVSRNGWYSPKF